MIKIAIFKNEKNLVTGYEVSGHADYAEEGRDIVCAAVSALTLAAVNGLEEHLKREVAYAYCDGHLQARLKQAPDDLTQAILASMEMALRDIAGQYPQRVRIKEHRR